MFTARGAVLGVDWTESQHSEEVRVEPIVPNRLALGLRSTCWGQHVPPVALPIDRRDACRPTARMAMLRNRERSQPVAPSSVSTGQNRSTAKRSRWNRLSPMGWHWTPVNVLGTTRSTSALPIGRRDACRPHSQDDCALVDSEFS